MEHSEAQKKFQFTIEPKPGGGFISRSPNPDLIVEGATREEVQLKVLDKIADQAGPIVGALIRRLEKSSALKNAPGSVRTIEAKQSWSMGNDPPQISQDMSPGIHFSASIGSQQVPSTEGGTKGLVKFLIVVGVLLLIFWMVYHH